MNTLNTSEGDLNSDRTGAAGARLATILLRVVSHDFLFDKEGCNPTPPVKRSLPKLPAMPSLAASTERNRLKRKRRDSQSMISDTVPRRQPRSENNRKKPAVTFEDENNYKLSATARYLSDLGETEDSSENYDFADDDSLDDDSPDDGFAGDLGFDPTEDYESDEEHDWLKPVRSTATGPDGVKIGTCTGNIVYRDSIRKDFYSLMEEPSQELAELAFGLFDRWGNIKSDYLEHPVKKGSGVWGKELNRGSFLYVENLKVNKDHYRQGSGRRMVEDVCTKARSARSSCRFAITWPVFVDNRPYEDRQADPCRPDRVARIDAGQTATENFWRSVGFRRIGSSPFFAFAMAGDLPSLALDKSEDYMRPLILRWPANDPKSTFPINNSILEADDDGTLALMKQRLQWIPPEDPSWLATDLHGRNIMHVLALMGKPRALAFVKTLPCATQLSSTRDLEGNTPFEWLRTKLDDIRCSQPFGGAILPMSDEFEGHGADHVACLAQLTSTSTTDSSQMERLRFGCTCGECIAGFISPRMAHALSLQGGLKGDELRDVDWKDWCYIDNHLLCHLPLDIQRKMTRSKVMCEGFAAVFFHLHAVLEAKRAPTTANILQQAAHERPSYTRTYIERGGTIAGPILGCFDSAMAEDDYLGDGEHSSTFENDFSELKECRNDHEFEFVRRQFLRMEGLAVEYPNEHKYRFG